MVLRSSPPSPNPAGKQPVSQSSLHAASRIASSLSRLCHGIQGKLQSPTAQGRGNLIIEYPGATEECVSIVGSHLDVVSANPEAWVSRPGELTSPGGAGTAVVGGPSVTRSAGVPRSLSQRRLICRRWIPSS